MFVLCLAPLLSGCMTLNPATGRQEFIAIQTPREVAMGQEISAKLEQQVKFSTDQAAQSRLERIGQRVAAVTERQDLPYRFFLVEDSELNAFTIPGGVIYFNTGLYNKLSSEDEIAAVLAHEIGHNAARHTIKKFQAALGYDIVGSLIFGAESEAAKIARMGADVLMNLGMSAYSRKDEYEADRLAVRYLTRAGYRPEALISTFRVLAANSKSDDNDWLLLRSHPYLGDRITAVKKEIETAKAGY